MKNYSTAYKFEKNGISYESKITGTIFDKANDEINFYHISKTLNKGFVIVIINAINDAIKNDAIFADAHLMQSNANEAYAVLINGDLYPVSINVSINVASNPFELLS